jgi:hypothetical protein
MQTEFVKAASMAAWVVAVVVLGYLFGTTSFAGWALLAVVSVVAPVLMGRFWGVPSPSMSETIREVLR